MKLRSIRLQNVRRFTRPVCLEGISNGVNVLCEPNEFGKSTLFDALQALVFKSHTSSDKQIRSLKPHIGGAPEISVDIETEDGRFTLKKRFLSKPIATVEQDGRVIAQADEAEAWIRRLAGSADGGPSGLLWVRQGITGLTSGSKKEDEAALSARRDLLSSVTGEVEAMTGGRRMDAALDRCRDELAAFVTSSGRAKTGGPWKAAQDDVEALSEDCEALEAACAQLRETLRARRAKRRELADLEHPDAVEARKTQLHEAETAYKAAQQFAEALDAEARKVAAARLEVTTLHKNLETLRAAQDELKRSVGEVETAKTALDAAQDAHGKADDETNAARQGLERAQSNLVAATERHETARKRQAAKDGIARRNALTEQIEKAQVFWDKMENARAEASRGPNAETLKRLEALYGELRTAKALRDSAAAQFVVNYEPGRDGYVLQGKAAIPDGEAVAIPSGAELTLQDIGTLIIHPGAGGQDDGSFERAETAYKALLAEIECKTIDAARTEAAARAAAERRFGEAQTGYQSLAPDGLEALRAALARIPDFEETDETDKIDQADTEADLVEAKAALIDAQAEFNIAAERKSDARADAARAEAVHSAALDRQTRAETALKGLEDLDADQLASDLERATTTLRAAEALHAEQDRAAPDLGAAKARLTRAVSVQDAAEAAIASLKPDLATLNERIARHAGDAVEERLAEGKQKLSAAEQALKRIVHEVAVLQKLQIVLQAVRNEARERYFEPVAAELKPLLQILWPEAELKWDDDKLLPTTLLRGGEEESTDVLSGGTQEQIALFVRLAFAKLLATRGQHAPIILDDALVFTDDDRIERMFDALHHQASDLQIIVFSCRQRAFRALGGHLLRLSEIDAVSEQNTADSM
ncbi:hypothetical protein [uncultured Maricaulis sp.]|uniref:AAA family ATPase n=1 Tax=uncultured Maricaulis sp. TaxID=174710 RepID=UPI0030D7A0CE|tara:strand:- start:1451 stop:4087 length:2637 start_codon:yes stop_codon:yes gene_type:complete